MNASLRVLWVVAAGCGGKAVATGAEPPSNKLEIVVLDEAPADALVLKVDAYRWACRISDGDGLEADELTVPVGRAVKLVITTRERSVEAPGMEVSLVGTTATRPAVEGKVSELVFRVDHPGTYAWKCPTIVPPGPRPEGYPAAQFDPVKPFRALPPAEFEAYRIAEREKTEPQTPEGMLAFGKRLYETKGCIACHTIDGSPRVGPSWKGIWGTTVTLSDGTSRLIDAAYVERSIVEPTAFARPGFPPSMPSYEGQLKERERAALILFIESLADAP